MTKAIIVIFLSISLLTALTWATTVYSSLNLTDREAATIEILREKFDADSKYSVTSLQPDGWTSVCATSNWLFNDSPITMKIDLKSDKFTEKAASEVRIVNGAVPYLSTTRKQSAIIFVYEEMEGKYSKIDVLRSDSSVLRYWADTNSSLGCFDRSNASFVKTVDDRGILNVQIIQKYREADAYKVFMSAGKTKVLSFQEDIDVAELGSIPFLQIDDKTIRIDAVLYDFDSDGNQDILVRLISHEKCENQLCPTWLLVKEASGQYSIISGPSVLPGSRIAIVDNSEFSPGIVFKRGLGNCLWIWSEGADQDFRCFTEKHLQDESTYSE